MTWHITKRESHTQRLSHRRRRQTADHTHTRYAVCRQFSFICFISTKYAKRERVVHIASCVFRNEVEKNEKSHIGLPAIRFSDLILGTPNECHLHKCTDNRRIRYHWGIVPRLDGISCVLHHRVLTTSRRCAHILSVQIGITASFVRFDGWCTAEKWSQCTNELQTDRQTGGKIEVTRCRSDSSIFGRHVWHMRATNIKNCGRHSRGARGLEEQNVKCYLEAKFGGDETRLRSLLMQFRVN